MALNKSFAALLMFITLALLPKGLYPETVSTYPGGNVLYWKSGFLLIPADFRQTPLADSHFSAASHVGTGMEMAMQDDRLSISVKAYFVPERSWIKVHDEDLLAHEQAHFDIEEYFARLARKELAQLKIKGKNFDQIRREADVIFARVLDKRSAFHEKFDKETNHSQLAKEEEHWEAEIKRLLDSTRNLENTEIQLY